MIDLPICINFLYFRNLGQVGTASLPVAWGLLGIQRPALRIRQHDIGEIIILSETFRYQWSNSSACKDLAKARCLR